MGLFDDIATLGKVIVYSIPLWPQIILIAAPIFNLLTIEGNFKGLVEAINLSQSDRIWT